MDSIQQRMLRTLVLDEIAKIVDELPVINPVDNIVDISVSRGTQGWQMYGSRKPGNEAYELVHYYHAEWEGGEWSDIEEENISDYEILDLLVKVSAQNADHISCQINENIKAEYEAKKDSIHNKVHCAAKPPSQYYGFDVCSKFTTRKEIETVVTHFLDSLQMGEYNLREIYQYTMILPEKYYNNYEEWLRVGFALHNTDRRLFIVWMLFSSQWVRIRGVLNYRVKMKYGIRSGL